MLKYIMAVAFVVMSGCSYNSAMYEIVKEETQMVNSVPKWFMADYTEIKQCGEDNKNLCIFGAGTSVSPDLNLAIEIHETVFDFRVDEEATYIQHARDLLDLVRRC